MTTLRAKVPVPEGKYAQAMRMLGRADAQVARDQTAAPTGVRAEARAARVPTAARTRASAAVRRPGLQRTPAGSAASVRREQMIRALRFPLRFHCNHRRAIRAREVPSVGCR